MNPTFTKAENHEFNQRYMKNIATFLLLFLAGFVSGYACNEELFTGPEDDKVVECKSSTPTCNEDGEDLVKKAASVVEETAQRSYSQDTEKKISYASVYPQADKNNVVIRFTIDEHNRIHVLEVKGGNALLNHYIKTSLEGKVLKTETSIPGMEYVMAVKIPSSV